MATIDDLNAQVTALASQLADLLAAVNVQKSYIDAASQIAVSGITGSSGSATPAVGKSPVGATAGTFTYAWLDPTTTPSASAGGTADALTATFTPAVASLVNGTALLVRATSVNATTTPTFAPNGLTAKTIVKGNNLPLLAGDIAGAGHWLELVYDATLTKWVLGNPASTPLSTVQLSASAGGTADALTATFVPAVPALVAGTALLVRAASANATATPTFAPNGLTAKTIVKGNNLPLVAGDIGGAGHWLKLVYDLTLDKWVLGNPVAIAAGVKNTPAGNVAATDVQAAINELDTEKVAKANILGTVSQSSGVPTGAIIETGTNANGTYTKWADGTMICTKGITTGVVAHPAAGSVFKSAAISAGSWAATFISAPTVSYGGTNTAGGGWIAQEVYPTASNCGSYSSMHYLAGSAGWTLYLTGVGRWF